MAPSTRTRGKRWKSSPQRICSSYSGVHSCTPDFESAHFPCILILTQPQAGISDIGLGLRSCSWAGFAFFEPRFSGNRNNLRSGDSRGAGNMWCQGRWQLILANLQSLYECKNKQRKYYVVERPRSNFFDTVFQSTHPRNPFCAIRSGPSSQTLEYYVPCEILRVYWQKLSLPSVRLSGTTSPSVEGVRRVVISGLLLNSWPCRFATMAWSLPFLKRDVEPVPIFFFTLHDYYYY